MIRANSDGYISSYPYGPSDNNTISSCDASFNSNNGITLYEEANNNTLSGNTAFNNTNNGINLNGLPSDLQDNEILANNASLNYNHGFAIINATGTRIFSNILSIIQPMVLLSGIQMKQPLAEMLSAAMPSGAFR